MFRRRNKHCVFFYSLKMEIGFKNQEGLPVNICLLSIGDNFVGKIKGKSCSKLTIRELHCKVSAWTTNVNFWMLSISSGFPSSDFTFYFFIDFGSDDSIVLMLANIQIYRTCAIFFRAPTFNRKLMRWIEWIPEKKRKQINE